MSEPATPGEFMAYLDAEMAALRHELYMESAMWWTEHAWIGVPYGPALCQAHPPVLRGLKAIIEASDG